MMSSFFKRNQQVFLHKWFRFVLALFLGFSLCLFLFQYQREKTFTLSKLNSVLQNYNAYLYQKIERKGFSKALIEDFLKDCPQKDLRITILSQNGEVYYESEKENLHENHANREEVIKAQKQGSGYSIRTSNSTQKKYFYSATSFPSFVYRSALPYDKYVAQLLSINKTFIYFMLAMAALMLFLFFRYASYLTQIINRLKLFAYQAEQDKPIDLNTDLFPHDELGDISRYIITLYHKLHKSKEELSEERNKIMQHFQFSKEGFAMFDSMGVEILSNNNFLLYLNILSNTSIRLSEEALTIEALQPIQSFLANSKNKHLEQKIDRESIKINSNGKHFLVECLLFKDSSYEISINDISYIEQESLLKKQLTQNIAHELKTPLSSIRGFLELILSSKEMDNEKKNTFLQRCFAQSERLSLLLKDISTLNSIEEGNKLFELSTIHLNILLQELLRDTEPLLLEKKMCVSLLLPENIQIIGNDSLLYSIFRNLLDNAINYAGEGSQITIECYQEDATYYYFLFNDNGIGIAEEHINRIFERFYRVDKGRSRKMGGTGLGLAIVKNAILFHKGNISAKNNNSGGVEFLFSLKKTP